jgi:hypothetical protein
MRQFACRDIREQSFQSRVFFANGLDLEEPPDFAWTLLKAKDFSQQEFPDIVTG